ECACVPRRLRLPRRSLRPHDRLRRCVRRRCYLDDAGRYDDAGSFRPWRQARGVGHDTGFPDGILSDDVGMTLNRLRNEKLLLMHGPPSASDLFRTDGTHAPSHPERSNRARIATLRAWRTVSVRSRAAAAEGYGLHAIP